MNFLLFLVQRHTGINFDALKLFLQVSKVVNIVNITANTLPQKKHQIMRFIMLFKVLSCIPLVQQSSGTAVFKHCVLNTLRHTVLANSSGLYYYLPTKSFAFIIISGHRNYQDIFKPMLSVSNKVKPTVCTCF